MSIELKKTHVNNPDFDYADYYFALSLLAFEYPPVDITSILQEKALDLSLIIPVVETTLLHAISQKSNHVACNIMVDIMENGLIEAKWLDMKDPHGFTPIHYAVRNQNDYMVDILLQCEVSLDITDGQGNTPLHLAVYGGRADYTETLAACGSSINARNAAGFTPLDVATSNGMSEIKLILQKYQTISNDDVKLYNVEDAHKAFDYIGDEQNGRHGIYIKDMLNNTPYRKRMRINNEQLDKIKALRYKFPNFNEVISHIVHELSLSLIATNSFVTFKPVLMHGAPGVGKTRFAVEVSKILKVPIKSLDGGSLSSSFSLSGVNASYKDAKPGAIAGFLLEEDYLNGIVFLDEIDKLSSRGESNHYAPLHKMLVPETATDFTDDFLGIAVNASYLNWIATANDVDVIPKSILSRFRLFEIPVPKPDQVKTIIDSILEDMQKNPDFEWSDAFDFNLPSNVYEQLLEQPVRTLKDRLYEGIARAAADNLNRKMDNNKKITLESKYFIEEVKVRRRYGFINN